MSEQNSNPLLIKNIPIYHGWAIEFFDKAYQAPNGTDYSRKKIQLETEVDSSTNELISINFKKPNHATDSFLTFELSHDKTIREHNLQPNEIMSRILFLTTIPKNKFWGLNLKQDENYFSILTALENNFRDEFEESNKPFIDYLATEDYQQSVRKQGAKQFIRISLLKKLTEDQIPNYFSATAERINNIYQQLINIKQ